MTVDRSLFVFAHDIVHEGAQAVVDGVVDRAGANGLHMATAYHGSRDLFPHGRGGRVRYLEPGATYFQPDLARYRDSPIKPVVSELVATHAPLAELLRAADRRALQVSGWTVFLHHDRISETLVGAPENAFGDVVRTSLCPSHPASRAYARALADDVAHQGVREVLAEALHHAALEHGGQHERYLVALGPRTRFLLGLCFCGACVGRATTAGVDATRLRAWVCAQVDEAFQTDIDDPPGDLVEAEVRSLAGGDLGGYLGMREDAVTSLAAELREVVGDAGTRLAFIDPAGASNGSATGRPTGATAAAAAWRWGIGLQGLVAAVDRIEVLAYASDPAQVDEDLEAYRAAIGGQADLAVAVRPTVPDSTTVDDLAAKVRAAIQRGASRLDFYHYGLMRLDALDRIGAACGLVGGDRRATDGAAPVQPSDDRTKGGVA